VHLGTRPLLRRLVLSAAVTVALLAPSTVSAQTGFRVKHEVGKSTATSVEVSGTIQNDTRAEAVDVSITVEAVGATGKTVARGVSFVTSRLPAGGTANFVAKVPAISGVERYRTTVSSRFVQGVEGP
jgi:hypothetical protein